MDKKRFMWYLLDSIFIIVFNLFFFLLGGAQHCASVWFSYVMIHVAYGLVLATPYLIAKGTSSTDYGRPVYVGTVAYFFVEFLTGLVFIFVAQQSMTAPILVQITILAVFAVFVLANLIANEHTAESVARHEKESEYVKQCCLKLKLLAGKTTDQNISKKIDKAYDIINASPLKSDASVADVEQKVAKKITELEAATLDESASSLIDEIINLANERNSRLQAKQAV